MDLPALQTLPVPAPACVLACGAFLKNSACLLQGTQVQWSPLHGDLSTPEACNALGASLRQLVARAGGAIDAVAHDLHPDFHSTRLALQWAHHLSVPALAVQHHQAHIAVAQAGQGLVDQALVGLALDGMGLGTDGLAWGGELLRVQRGGFERLAHLPLLALPGGDAAAREPWRLAAALLHELGRGDEIVPRFGPVVGGPLARGVHAMLQRDLNCPRTSSAGRWFDAAAGALGLSVRQAEEAEAAIALERRAREWLGAQRLAGLPPPSLELRPMVAALLDEPDAGRGAARFHVALARGLVAAAVAAAADAGTALVALGGGCFFNRLLRAEVGAGLQAAGLRVLEPAAVGWGDAGLALGQAWAAAQQLAHAASPEALAMEA